MRSQAQDHLEPQKLEEARQDPLLIIQRAGAQGGDARRGIVCEAAGGHPCSHQPRGPRSPGGRPCWCPADPRPGPAPHPPCIQAWLGLQAQMLLLTAPGRGGWDANPLGFPLPEQEPGPDLNVAFPCW